jgi:hypothetical protein
MKPELRNKIITYNKSVAEKADKASDLDIIVSQIMKLPKGQLKKVLTDEVVAVLEKYGISFE